MCSLAILKGTHETAISVFWYSTNLKMPNNFSLVQNEILQSGISVSGLAVREREIERKKARSAVSQPRRDENKAKIVQIRPKVLNIRQTCQVWRIGAKMAQFGPPWRI